ncbi:hypothetical protein LINGRAHAP2_LOCUS16940 [Linum grandiflorum]
MAANLISKLLRRTSPPTANLSAALHKASPPAGPIFAQRILPDLTPRPIPFFGVPTPKICYYPSFPFGQLLNPIPAGGKLDLVETEDEVIDDAADKTMRADSVKKKRKKKMNKHKYKKLRKRLRRKSRS